MKDRTIEKLLYKLGVLLVICGAAIRLLQLSENYLGLYLVLAGHVLGVVGIFIYMKHVNDREQERQAMQEPMQQLQNK